MSNTNKSFEVEFYDWLAKSSYKSDVWLIHFGISMLNLYLKRYANIESIFAVDTFRAFLKVKDIVYKDDHFITWFPSEYEGLKKAFDVYSVFYKQEVFGGEGKDTDNDPAVLDVVHVPTVATPRKILFSTEEASEFLGYLVDSLKLPFDQARLYCSILKKSFDDGLDIMPLAEQAEVGPKGVVTTLSQSLFFGKLKDHAKGMLVQAVLVYLTFLRGKKSADVTNTKNKDSGEDFLNWLNSQGYARPTSNSYFGTMNLCAQKVAKNQLADEDLLAITDLSKLLVVRKAFFAFPEIVALPPQAKSRYVKAFEKYLEYRGYEAQAITAAESINQGTEKESESQENMRGPKKSGLTDDFRQYLLAEGYAASTCVSIVSAVSQCNRIAVGRGLTDNIFAVKAATELSRLKGLIFGDSTFVAYDNDSNNRFSKAYDKLVEWRLAVAAENLDDQDEEPAIAEPAGATEEITAPVENEAVVAENYKIELGTKSSEVEAVSTVALTESKSANQVYTVNFGSHTNYAYTKPVELYYSGQYIELNNRSWKCVYTQLLTRLCSTYESKIKQLTLISDAQTKFYGWVATFSRRNKLRSPAVIAPGLLLETNISATGIVEHITEFLKLCDIPFDSVIIKYIRKADEELPKERVTYSSNEAEIRSEQLAENGSTSPREFAPVSEAAAPPPSASELELFTADLRQNYPNGFNFSGTAQNIIEARVGRSFDENVQNVLKKQMFARRDGLYFFRDQICDDGAVAALLESAKELLAQYPFFCLDQLIVGHEAFWNNLEDQTDKRRFVEFIKDNSEFASLWSFTGGGGNRICYLATDDGEEVKQRLADELHQLLFERGDAVAIDELAELYPVVNIEWLQKNIPALLTDVIKEKIDDSYIVFKLQEFYYLPLDIQEVFAQVLADLEASGTAITTVTFAKAVGDRYECDFMGDYALSESVLKQLMEKLCLTSDYKWVGKALVKTAAEKNVSMREKFEEKYPGFFAYSDYEDYQRETLGTIKDKRTTTKELTGRYIHYRDNVWSQVAFFQSFKGWDELAKEKIISLINGYLGNKAFISVIKIPDYIIDEFPKLYLQEQEVEWTRELIASVVFHCLPSINLLNHEKALHTLTDIIVPPGIEDKSDGLEYMLSIYCIEHSYDKNAEGAFAFLKENNVRVCKSAYLDKIIIDYLSRAT